MEKRGELRPVTGTKCLDPGDGRRGSWLQLWAERGLTGREVYPDGTIMTSGVGPFACSCLLQYLFEPVRPKLQSCPSNDR